MACGSTESLTELNTLNLPGNKAQPARKAGNLTATFVTIVYDVWEPRYLNTLWAFTAYLCLSGLPMYFKKEFTQEVLTVM
jgi:hypothetical protein